MDVFAFVGPSGTGKSHRAGLVARENEIELIIDDGLLIKDSQIIAGRSAKREETFTGAVNRALFADPEHAREVKAAIRAFSPSRLLVLGTSHNMVHRICDALDIPRPERYIHIEDVASPAEMRRARRMRREQGKHVIPAPTVEVRKTFSGYLVDPLRFFVRERKKAELEEEVIEKSVVRPTFSALGRFVINDTVISAIAARAALDVPGISRASQAVVDKATTGVRLTMDVTVRYGEKLYPVLEDVQRKVKEVVEHMTALNVLEVNVTARRISLDAQ